MDTNNDLILFDHNKHSYEEIKNAFSNGKNIVSIVQATGTGKSYVALKLALDNKDKNILYVTPTNPIIEHINETISKNKLKLNNIKFRTYSSLIETDEKKEELKNIKADYIILDEMHHTSAPIWGKNIKKLIDTHPNAKVLGMSAYTVRDRGTAQEKDITDPLTNEIFSGSVVNNYSIVDAMNDRVLPKPIYKSAYVNLKNEVKSVEEKLIRKNPNNQEFRLLMGIIEDVKKQIENAPGIEDVIKKNIKPGKKYIYFCPPVTSESVSSIEEIKEQAINWFKEIVPEQEMVIYTTTSKQGNDGKKNRDAFYNDIDLDGNDASDKLRVMFAINQYNEGVHAPNIDGVILGRNTSSDIVYFEQLGRALSVRENTKEEIEKYMSYSLRQLREECKKRDIVYTDYDSEELLINKLTSPVIIDLVNNYDYIKELENSLRNKIKENNESKHKDVLKLRSADFDIEIENKNIHEMLDYVVERLNLSWLDYYEYARNYYNTFGNLNVPRRFKTNDGTSKEQDGFIDLGNWILIQRLQKRDGTLPKEREDLLNKLEMRWDNVRNNFPWDEMFSLAEIYYKKNENLNIPRRFRTNNGYTFDENGKYRLGTWVAHQRLYYSKGNLSQDRIDKLNTLNMRWDNIVKQIPFEQMVEYLKLYKEHNHSLNIPYEFKTNDGYTYDKNGEINLGTWLSHRKAEYYKQTLNLDKLNILKDLGVKFDMSQKKSSWDEMYELATELYNQNGNIDVSKDFVYKDKGLGAWIALQQQAIFAGTIEQDKLLRLDMLGIRKTKVQYSFDEAFDKAQEYYNKNGNLNIKEDYKTEDGFSLGKWKTRQRYKYHNNELSEEQIDKLNTIGFDFSHQLLSFDSAFKLAEEYYKIHNTIDTKKGDKLPNNDFDIHKWILNQRAKYHNNELSEDQINKLNSLNMRWDNNAISWDEMYNYAKKYISHNGDLLVKGRFKTDDGYTYNEEGKVSLGRWIFSQRYKKNHSELDQDKILKLDMIGMVWNINKNIEEKHSTVSIYNIDYNKNKELIDKIPSTLLEAKILYLIDNQISIADENGILHEIFTLSNEKMLEKYNINIEDLLNNYYISKRGR